MFEASSHPVFLEWLGFYTIIASWKRRIGSVFKYFEKNSVAAIQDDFGELAVGDMIRVKGNDTNFTQKVDAMEFDHKRSKRSPVDSSRASSSPGPAKPFRSRLQDKR